MVSARRQEILELVDQIPEDELASAKRYLQYLRDMGDPVLRTSREAPFDDEPVTDEDRAAMEEGKRDYERGETISTEQLRRNLGL